MMTKPTENVQSWKRLVVREDGITYEHVLIQSVRCATDTHKRFDRVSIGGQTFPINFDRESLP